MDHPIYFMKDSLFWSGSPARCYGNCGWMNVSLKESKRERDLQRRRMARIRAPGWPINTSKMKHIDQPAADGVVGIKNENCKIVRVDSVWVVGQLAGRSIEGGCLWTGTHILRCGTSRQSRRFCVRDDVGCFRIRC